MNISQLVKKHLPNYIFNDASNRSCAELKKINKLSIKNELFLIYIKRNQLNNPIFLVDKDKQTAVELLLHKGVAYWFDEEITENNLAELFLFKKRLENTVECVVCYTEFPHKPPYNTSPVICCNSCSVIHCETCFNKMIKNTVDFQCSICRDVKNIIELCFKKS